MPRSRKKDHSKFYVEEMPDFLNFTVDETWLQSPVSALIMELKDTIVALQGARQGVEIRGNRRLETIWLTALVRRLEEDKLGGTPSTQVVRVAETHCFQKEAALQYGNRPAEDSHLFNTRMLLHDWQHGYDEIRAELDKRGFSDNLFGRLLVATMVAKERAWRRECIDLWHPLRQASDLLAETADDPVAGLAQVVEKLEQKAKSFGMENQIDGIPSRVALTFIRNQMVA